MSHDALAQRHCPVCDRVQLFEQPLCGDGHGPHCPELICVECGTALVIEVASGHLDLGSVAARRGVA